MKLCFLGPKIFWCRAMRQGINGQVELPSVQERYMHGYRLKPIYMYI